jgi:hypothetical protein
MSEKAIVENEIENVIRDFNIDRSRFSKVSEEKSKEIVDDVFYSYADISRYTKVSLNRIYDKLDERFQNYLSKGINFGELSWEEFLGYIYQFAPKKDNMVYLIVAGYREEDYAIIYEGELSEVIKVLFNGVPLGNNGDFTIVPKHYDWLIYYHDTQERLRYITENVQE